MSNTTAPKLPGTIIDSHVALISGLRATGALLHEEDGVDDVIETADASDLATSIALANALRAWWATHIADTDKHIAADSTNTTTAPVATDLAETQTLLNEIKTDFNAHHDAAAYHHVGGEGGPVAAPADVTTANATDQSTANALANALKAACNRHVRSGAQLIAVS